MKKVFGELVVKKRLNKVSNRTIRKIMEIILIQFRKMQLMCYGHTSRRWIPAGRWKRG